MEFQKTDANYIEECHVRSKDIFIYDKSDKEKFDFIKKHASYVLNDSFYHLVKDYPDFFSLLGLWSF